MADHRARLTLREYAERRGLTVHEARQALRERVNVRARIRASREDRLDRALRRERPRPAK